MKVRFHKGETTYSEVLQKLGKPSQTTILGNGTKMINYTYISSQARPETFIPVVGAFVGGADSEHSFVTMVFDSNDVLTNMTSTHGSTGAGHGFEGISQPRNSAQPRVVE